MDVLIFIRKYGIVIFSCRFIPVRYLYTDRDRQFLQFIISGLYGEFPVNRCI